MESLTSGKRMQTGEKMDGCIPLSLRVVEGEMSGRVLSPSSRVLGEQVRVCVCVFVYVCVCTCTYYAHSCI